MSTQLFICCTFVHPSPLSVLNLYSKSLSLFIHLSLCQSIHSSVSLQKLAILFTHQPLSNRSASNFFHLSHFNKSASIAPPMFRLQTPHSRIQKKIGQIRIPAVPWRGWEYSVLPPLLYSLGSKSMEGHGCQSFYWQYSGTDVEFDYKASNLVQKYGRHGDGKLLHSKKLKGRGIKENVGLITLARCQVTSEKNRKEKKNF